MRLLLIFLAIFALVAGMAGAQWYPRSENYSTTGDVLADNGIFTGDLTVAGIATITGGTVNGGVYDGDFRFAANHFLYSTAGTGGLDFSNATGIFKSSTGTNTFYGNVVIAANKSLSGSSGSGAVDFSGMTGGYSSPLGTNTFNGNILGAGLTTTTTGGGAVTLKGNTTIYTDKSLAVTTADKLTVAGVVVRPGILKRTLAAGTAAATNVTVAGMVAEDELISVVAYTTAASIASMVDRTSEYAVGTGMLTKAAGTNSTGNQLDIMWMDKT